MKHSQRLLAILLVLTMLLGVTAMAADRGTADAGTADHSFVRSQNAPRRVLPAPEEQVTFIVELEDQPDGSISIQSAGNRGSVKRAVSALIGASRNSRIRSSGTVDFGYDYDVLFQGFSVEAPYGILKDIRAIPGVKRAFPAATYHLNTEETDAVLLSGYENDPSQSLAGVTPMTERGITGKGQVIGIVDTGLDVTHEAFSGSVASPALTYSSVAAILSASDLNCEELSPGLGAGSVYYSDKIAFTFSYADKNANVTGGDSHGTHVAGIAAANGGGVIRGAAPDAQLAIFKVFRGNTGFCSDDDILAALEDAAVLGVTSVNMSLGSTAGFADYPADFYETVYENLRGRNILVFAAAGNEGTVFEDSYFNSAPPAWVPDASTANEPANYAGCLSVASFDAGYLDAISAGGRDLPCIQGDGEYGAASKWSLSGSYPYVDCGLGTAEDISNGMAAVGRSNLNGCVALISRGDTTFEEKSENAYSVGAEAVLIYDNRADSTPVGLSLGYFDAIPVFGLTQAGGQYLLSLTDRTLTFDWSHRTFTGTPSSFSSWGPTPDLQLKPEISAAGGDIYSSVPGGYEYMGGTSMATPQIAGIAAALCGVWSPDTVETVMMNTAIPYRSGSSWYSPRKQGAGMVNAVAAADTDVILTVDGEDRPKAELGDGYGPYRFSFTLHSFSSVSRSFSLDAAALAQDIADGIYLPTSTDYNGRGVTVSFSGEVSGDTVTVAPFGEARVTVTISVDGGSSDFRSAISEAENGSFLDGFVLLQAAGSGVDLTVPFLAFYGDYGALPVFDSFDDPALAESYLSDYSLQYVLGQNHGEEEYCMDWNRCAISPSSYDQYYTEVRSNTSTLRNLESMDVAVLNSDGETVWSLQGFNLPRTYYDYDNNDNIVPWYPEDVFMTEYYECFDGHDNWGHEVPEGSYTYQVTAKPVIGEAQSYSVPLYYDLTAPEIAYSITAQGGRQVLTVRVTDNHYVSHFFFDTASDESSVSYFNDMYFTEVGYQQGRYDNVTKIPGGYEVTYDLAELKSRLAAAEDSTDEIYFAALDYALIPSEKYIDLTHETAPLPPVENPPDTGLPGDINDDGSRTMADVVLLARAAAGNLALDAGAAQRGDVTGDGSIDLADVVKLARFVAKLIGSL